MFQWFIGPHNKFLHKILLDFWRFLVFFKAKFLSNNPFSSSSRIWTHITCRGQLLLSPLFLRFSTFLNFFVFFFTLFVSAEQEDEEANTGSHLKLIVDAFIQQLPNCVNRDLIDKVL